jgi:Uma2 family endonuclease
MPNTPRKPPPRMTVAEFIEWPGDGTGGRSQLVDGEVREIPPGSVARGLIHTNLNYLVASHLKSADGPYCALIRPSIVPRVRSSLNLRTPALGVAATPDRPDQFVVSAPILLIEILTPDNTTDVWGNVWSYCTIPSVQEIAVVHSTRVLAELLRRGRDGHWPEEPEEIGPDGTLSFASIGLICPLYDVYAQTHLGRDEPT